MKNILNYKCLGLAVTLISLGSCSDGNNTDSQRITKSVVTATQTSYTINEGESANITLNVDTPINDYIDLKLEIISDGSTAGLDDFTIYDATTQFTDVLNQPLVDSNQISSNQTTFSQGLGIIGYKVLFPAFQSTYTFSVKALNDLLPDGTETLKLRLRSTANGKGLVAAGSDVITIKINNVTSNNFVSRLNWDGAAPDAFGTIQPASYTGTDTKKHQYCSFDFDLEVYDSNFNLIDATYSSYTHCPEEVVLDATLTPDGDYFIVPSFWSRTAPTGYAPKSGEIIYPAKVTMAKPGVFIHTTDLTGKFKYSVGGAAQNNPDAYVPVSILTKTGNTYVLTDFNDPTIVQGSGRLANLAQRFRNAHHFKR
jgi:hypothetical protein